VRWDFVEAALLRGDGETEIVGVERREKEKEKRKALQSKCTFMPRDVWFAGNTCWVGM
jgi:hypothetical protein